MREQMSHGRAFRAGRLVEVDHALLRRDERRESRDELRHRSPAHHLGAGAASRDDVAVPQHAGSRKRCGPVVDLLKCFIHRRAILDVVDRRLVSSGSPLRADDRLLAGGARRPPRLRSRHVRRDAGRRRPASGRVRAGEALPGDHRRRPRPRRELRRSTSSAPAPSSWTPQTGRRSAAPTARCSATSGRRAR